MPQADSNRQLQVACGSRMVVGLGVVGDGVRARRAERARTGGRLTFWTTGRQPIGTLLIDLFEAIPRDADWIHSGGVVGGVDRVVGGQRTKAGFALAEGARQLDLQV